MDRDSGRYENVGVSQFQSINNPHFGGQGITVSKMRYVHGNSPSKPSSSVIVSPGSPGNRNNEVRYVAIDSQLEKEAHAHQNQGYINPFQETRENQSAFLENAGVKRVTSYTSFVTHQPQSPYQPTSITPMANHGHGNYFHAQ